MSDIAASVLQHHSSNIKKEIWKKRCGQQVSVTVHTDENEKQQRQN